MAALYSRLEDDENKPLPSLPSPTLTNPDLVLPDNGFSTYLSSPTQSLRQPSNASYLRDKTKEHGKPLATPNRDQQEKRGLMSRKTMLARNQTGSVIGQEDASLPMASSPLLHDPVTISSNGSNRRDSGSSIDSEEMAKMPDFLQKYRNIDMTEDEMTDAEGLAPDATTYDEQRRVKEEEEQVSALLSKRAEEILANAKKRLNLMEGNLRGARDLVAPLTAANLKRATSLSYSHGSPSLAYTHRRLESSSYDPDPYNPSRRMLQSQASSPSMRQDYLGHVRAGSDLDLDRPHTSMSRSRFPIRTPEKGRSPDLSHTLRSTRSYDSFGISKLSIPQSTNARSKPSPESSLEPVSEDDAPQHIETSYRNSLRAPEVVPAVGLGVMHPTAPSVASSTASEDLRDQMASLKGRISSLRERAREDSMRRASSTNLRSPSAFSHASNAAPELWYNESSSQGSGSPANSPYPERSWSRHAPTASRNAFAEMAARQHTTTNATKTRTYNEKYRDADTHQRTPSGTAILTSKMSSVELPGMYPESDHEADDRDSIYDDQSPDDDISTEYSEDAAEQDQESVYEEPAANPNVVAHEDREDAFDYEHFFLHSAMGTYNAGRITPDSDGSDGESVSSTETARAPTTRADGEDYIDQEDEPPQPPGTPDALKKIEARLQHQHERTMSRGSMSTLNSFATAYEAGSLSRSVSRNDLMDTTDDLPRSRIPSRSTSRLDLYSNSIAGSRPTTSARSSSRLDLPTNRNSIISRSGSRLDYTNTKPSTAAATQAVSTTDLDDGSDRADSGVGGLSNANGRITPKSTADATSAISAPSSPASAIDPTALAYTALLDPAGKALSPKDAAVMTGLIDSLRRVCVRLQEEDQFESAVLRRRLDDARRVLDGLGVSEHDG